MKSNNDQQARRAFLKRVLLASAAGTGLFSDPAMLGLWPQLAAAERGNEDFKALVCIFLLGGNDGHNLVVPTDANGPAVLGKLLDRWPVERIGEKEAA